MMLQPDPAELVGDRQQEFVMIVMLRAERLHRLVDEPLVRVDLLGRGGELVGAVGEDVQVDARATAARPCRSARRAIGESTRIS